MPDLSIGERIDPAAHQRTGEKTALDSADLTTHAVIVGMTGSGKTGLGLVLIEEALQARIPVLMIDPKGDLTNLLLTFPQLRAEDFRPWIDERAAQQAGVSSDAFAAQEAEKWTKGLADWGLDGTAIEHLRTDTRFTIYTPGSRAGIPLNIIGSLRAPASGTDPENVRDEVDGFVSGLLGLVGVDADPLASREHILLANLIETSWTARRDLDLPTLVAQVADPPLRKLGVFELDEFFPPKDRRTLAMKLNGLLASPAFAAWADGPPLDIGALLWPGGATGGVVVTTAHLSESERQFVTALVLGKVVTWMRSQSGTTDLRALVYVDEVAGYLPPTAAPPTKAPIMTLMKQARAFGVGMVLSTQNPVDVDYKALSNAGTWAVGRLQTERDKERLLNGMSAAAGGVDIGAVGDTISGLAKREFVLRQAGEDKPDVVTSRWAMSYLRGPLTRDQIAKLMVSAPERTPVAPAAPTAPAVPATAPATASTPAPTTAAPAPPPEAWPPPAPAHASAPAPQPATPELAGDESLVPPPVAEGVTVSYLDPAAPWASHVGAVAGGTRLIAGAVARVRLLYDDTAADLRHTEEWEAVLFPLSAAPDPGAAIAVDYDDRDLRPEPPAGAKYVTPEASTKTKTFWTGLKRGLTDQLAADRSLEIHRNRELKLWSRVGEGADAFAARCQEAADAGADKAAAKLRDTYEARLTRARDALARAEDRVEVAVTEAKGRRNEEVLSTAGGLLDSFLGGRGGLRSVLRKVGSGAGRRTRTTASGHRAEAAKNRVDEAATTIEDLEAELMEELAEIEATWDAKVAAVEPVDIGLERTDVSVVSLGLVWIPT